MAKRGIKTGTRRSPERVNLELLKAGSVFYTSKTDKDMTALASVCSKRIRTERMIAIHPLTLEAERIVKCTIL